MDKKVLIEVGKRIKEVRNHLQISQGDFAARMGISRVHLSAVEIGKMKPGFNFLYKADQIFNINPLYIFKGFGIKLINQLYYFIFDEMGFIIDIINSNSICGCFRR